MELTNLATPEDLIQWEKVSKELTALKHLESTLRRKIFGTYFPVAEEGTNTFMLAEKTALKGERVINRNIDKPALIASGEQFTERGINVDKLVDWKPSLVLSVYRKLTDEQMKLFDTVMTIKDGSPKLSIVEVKR